MNGDAWHGCVSQERQQIDIARADQCKQRDHLLERT
jgi:hypothetical protein